MSVRTEERVLYCATVVNSKIVLEVRLKEAMWKRHVGR